MAVALKQQQQELQEKRKRFDEDKRLFDEEHQRYMKELEDSMRFGPLYVGEMGRGGGEREGGRKDSTGRRGRRGRDLMRTSKGGGGREG